MEEVARSFLVSEQAMAKRKANGQPVEDIQQNTDNLQQSPDTKAPTGIPDLLDEPADSSGKSDLQIPQQ